MTLKWHGGKFKRETRREMRFRVRNAALLIKTLMVRSMKKGGRFESGISKQKKGTKRTMVDAITGAKKGKIGSFRSKPGEPPRVQTGTLRRAIKHEMHKKLPIARIGTVNLKYAKALEFGTRNMRARPFMRPAWKLGRKLVKKIFTSNLGLG